MAFEGEVFRLRDAKGLVFLTHLLRHPGREFHAFDLVRAGATADAVRDSDVGAHLTANHLAAEGLSVSGPNSGVAMLDPRAKTAYRTRLAELRREIEEATRCRDSARLIRAQEELDFLTRELARSLGLGGRDRAVGSVAEQARVNVTRAIRRALASIAAHHPALGDHLARTIKTGRFCCYALDPRNSVPWMV